MLSWGNSFIQHSSTSPSFEHLLFQSRSRRLFWIEQIQSFPNIFENFLPLPGIGPPKLSSLVVRSLECRNIVSFLSLQGLPEVPTIEFFPADVYMHRKLDIPFYSRNKNVLSSSRLIYQAPIPCFKYFSLPDTFIMPCGQTENLTRMRFEWSVFQKDQKLV